MYAQRSSTSGCLVDMIRENNKQLKFMNIATFLTAD